MISTLRSCWLKNPGDCADLDYDGNGVIDPNDLRQFRLRLGKKLPPGAGTGPTPSARSASGNPDFVSLS